MLMPALTNCTVEELNKLEKNALIAMVMIAREQMSLITNEDSKIKEEYSQATEKISQLTDENAHLQQKVERLTNQLRQAIDFRFGRHSEKMSVIIGQTRLFDMPENTAQETETEELIPAHIRKRRPKGKREADLSGLPEETIRHSVPKEELDRMFGPGNYRLFKTEEYKRLRINPAKYTVEKHIVEVYVGTGGEHQDEFMRGDRGNELFRNSIVTPSLLAWIVNAKYVNSLPYRRIEQELERNGICCINRQNMTNWSIQCAERYLRYLCLRLKMELLDRHVIQCDETPVQVINETDSSGARRSPGTKGWMWVFITGEYDKARKICLFEYHQTRHHKHALEFLEGFHGTLVTDGLAQYHLIEKKNPHINNGNCWAHARRILTGALKGLKKDLSPEELRKTTAWQALKKVGKICDLDKSYKDLSTEDRREMRQKNIKPLVDDFISWAKSTLSSQLPESETARGLNYCVNQEKYLRVFLDYGDVPLDNNASERAIRTVCVGKKNWLFFNSTGGVEAGAIIYSITETAKLNNLNPYQYLNYLFTELPKYVYIEEGKEKIDPKALDPLLPWSKELPAECYRPQ